MRKEIVWMLVIVAFVCGLFAGRKFPAHHYVTLPAEGSLNTLLLDTKTGKVCDPFAYARTNKTPVPACPN
jgi:hypothetical protein